MTRVACVGECMIELREAEAGLYARGYGGDTLNTAVYLARLGIGVDYITALGDDAISDHMIADWAAEGVGTGRVARLPGKLPGLYMIRTDGNGERQFFHWREHSAARSLMDLAATADILQSLAGYEMIYFSAITLSIFAEPGRARLITALEQARQQGARVAFDTNFRARGWPDLELARAAYRRAFEVADIALASIEDLLPLYPDHSPESLLARIVTPEAVLKLSEPTSIVRVAGRLQEIKAEPLAAAVIDTTAAGDSFAAAYLAARLAGSDAIEASRAGHRLAGVVVGHPGAIIPRSAMPARAPLTQPSLRKGSP